MLTTLLIKRKLKKYNGILAGLGYHIEARDHFKKFSYNNKEYYDLDECYYAICRDILSEYHKSEGYIITSSQNLHTL